MKLCPTCGEVFPGREVICPAHSTPLLDWSDMSNSHSVVTAVDDNAGPFEDTGTLTRPGDLTDPEVSPRATPTPPQIVEVAASVLAASPRPTRILGDRYRLGRHIGIGGYGAVFDAYDQRLDKRVAVKVLSPAVAQDEEVVHRFKREAIAASRVRHECIVDVTDYDIDAAGVSFIVMEYLDGCDLSDVLANDGPLAPARALAIAAQCASALTAAHDAGILHRDLKPANIFLVKSTSRPDFVKIIDFGISKFANSNGHYSDVTDASKVVGTPYYMSPEQGQGRPLDGRTDVYALGVILFEMLTHERPFIGASALEILTCAMDQPRVPPSSRRSELAEIPGLDQLVVRAIAADRRERFASMKQFGEAIAGCLSEIDASRLLGLPSIDHEAGATRSGSGRRSARRDDATELVHPSTLEGSSGEITVPHRVGAVGRWTVPRLGALLIAAALAGLWVHRVNEPGAATHGGAPPPATPMAAARPELTGLVPPEPAEGAPPEPAPDPAPPPENAAPPVTRPASVPAKRASDHHTAPPPENAAPPVTHPAPAPAKRASGQQTVSREHSKRRKRPRKTIRRARANRPAKPAIGIKDW